MNLKSHFYLYLKTEEILFLSLIFNQKSKQYLHLNGLAIRFNVIKQEKNHQI